MHNMIAALGQYGLDKEVKMLAPFYETVKRSVDKIDNAAARQKLLVKLYDNFFRTAFKKTADRLGIVYTPVEVVDFILHSVDAVLRRQFGKSLSDEGVNVIDPFTGTGTFITRFLQSGIISAADIKRKYRNELFANEIVLLAYYIAAVNIENAYHYAIADADGEASEADTSVIASEAKQPDYEPFEGICFTDTFELFERGEEAHGALEYDYLRENSERAERQQKTPIRVIVGNPPYSVGQTSANDNAQNLHYAKLERTIQDTYIEKSEIHNKTALYDSYIKAFKWATLRLGDAGGVIGFITNAGWIDALAMDGMRKCFAEDFSDIYVFNLRGNCRTSGELRRQEGDNIFGLGSRAAIAISILVKNPKRSGCKIHYYAVADYMTREEKLRQVETLGSIENSAIRWQSITPNEKGDWINQRNSTFHTLMPIVPDVKFSDDVKSVFVTYSRGMGTGHDVWACNSSKAIVKDNMQKHVAFYNAQVDAFRKAKKSNPKLKAEDFKDNDKTKISWSSSMVTYLQRCENATFDATKIVTSLYRPFNKQCLYVGDKMIHERAQWPRLFPTPAAKNLVICCESIGTHKDFTCLIVDMIPDLHVMSAAQCFPLYYYTEERAAPAGEFAFDTKYSAQIGELALTKRVRHDGVSDWILHKAREKYSDGDGKRGSVITKGDIFYYVYGFLHSPDYREKFKADLKKSLPRIPLVDGAEDFWAFSRAGRELSQLHLHYEDYAINRSLSDFCASKNCIETAPTLRVVGAECGDYRVQKMKWADKDKKDTLIYNSKIRIEGIPAEGLEYVVNGRSALGWVMERYQVKTDKDSGITNDPNDWAREQGKPRYILDLVLSVIEVSVRTVGIVRGLPRAGEWGKHIAQKR